MSHPTITETARCLTLIASRYGERRLIGNASLIKHSAGEVICRRDSDM